VQVAQAIHIKCLLAQCVLQKKTEQNQGRRAAVHLPLPVTGVQTAIPSAINQSVPLARDELPNGSNVRAVDLRGALEAARIPGVT
jgi:hypothetical protein